MSFVSTAFEILIQSVLESDGPSILPVTYSM